MRCLTCAKEGREVWVIPGRNCGYCGTPCDDVKDVINYDKEDCSGDRARLAGRIQVLVASS